MGLLSRLFARSVPDSERLEQLENALGEVRRKQDALVVEWESVLDKIGKFSARQAARARREVEKHLAEPDLPTPPPPEATARGLVGVPKHQLRAMLARGEIRKLGG